MNHKGKLSNATSDLETIKKYKKPSNNDERELFSYIDKRASEVANEINEKISKSTLDNGGLYFIDGPVNSGKSIVACNLYDLFNEKNRNPSRKCICSQPFVNRPDVIEGAIYSRNGVTRPALSFKNKEDIETMFHDNSVVIVDEVQFIPYDMQVFFNYELINFISRGGWAIIISLHYTSQKMEFILPALLYSRADFTYQLSATCQMCGNKGAVWNQRLIDGKAARQYAPDLQPPNHNIIYEPRCDNCLII